MLKMYVLATYMNREYLEYIRVLRISMRRAAKRNSLISVAASTETLLITVPMRTTIATIFQNVVFAPS